MQTVKFICVGKMRERHYSEAFEEYRKRLGAFCDFELAELPETHLLKAAQKELERALAEEAALITRAALKNAPLVAMCVEGRALTSAELSRFIADAGPGLCFVVGGSNGLHESVKQSASMCLSMSKMTFPHHLARVMLIEQVYRAYTIERGGKYHK